MAIDAAGTDYNVYVPIPNALGALGKQDALKKVRQRAIQAYEAQLRGPAAREAHRSRLLSGTRGSGGHAERGLLRRARGR